MGKASSSGILRFFRTHWPHVLLAIPMALVVTAVHEAAHAAAVVVQGGTLLEFVFVPNGSEWGHVRYVFPQGVAYSSTLISVAPYLLSGLLAVIAALFSLKKNGYPLWLASTFFIWLYLVALADIGYAGLGWLLGGRNDLYFAFGDPTATGALFFMILALAGAVAGYPVQRGLYGERSLPGIPYSVLAGAACVLLIAGTTVL